MVTAMQGQKTSDKVGENICNSYYRFWLIFLIHEEPLKYNIRKNTN